MKLKQNARHFAARKALEVPVVRSAATRALVRLHTRVFLAKADPAHREERREHLDDLFDATLDAYLTALQAGYTEAEAREITHIQANLDFLAHGWLEMMEFPADEAETHLERYEAFFDRHGITVDDPLGVFRPPGGLAEAPPTLAQSEGADQPNAEGGYADDVYVDTGEEVVVGGLDEPADVELTDAPGVGPEDLEADADEPLRE